MRPWFPSSPWIDIWRAREWFSRDIRGCVALRAFGVVVFSNRASGVIAVKR